MIARTTRIVCELVAAALLGVMLLVGIAGWRLAQGPVPLDFLTPHLVRALNGEGSPFRVTVERTTLAWAGWARALDIRVGGVRAMAEDGRVVANVPEMSVSLSVRGILRGIAAPTGIDVIGPTLRLDRDERGALSMALGDKESESEKAAPEVLNRLILAIQSAPDPNRPVTYLKRIRILDARLIIDDRLTGLVWGAPQADIVVIKDDGELRGTFFVKLDIGGAETKLDGAASWRPDSDVIRIETAFAGARIDRLAAKLPAYKSLEALRFDVWGRADMVMSAGGLIKSASFDLNTGKGQVVYPQLWPKGLPVTSAQLRGKYDGETERLEIDQVTADLDGPRITGQATAIRLGEGLRIDGQIAIDAMQLSRLSNYWPQPIADRTRDWIINNMPSGDVLGTTIAMSLGVSDLAGGAVSVDAMSGTLKLRNTTIRYLEGLPPVEGVVASAVFSRDRFIARVREGKSAGLNVTAGQVRLTDLQSDNEQAAIDVTVEGALADALALIDRPRLGFASRLGLQPASVGGKTRSQLKFAFPLLNDLSLDAVEIQTFSRLRRPKVPNLAFGRTVSAEYLTLKVDKAGMELAGQAKIGEINAAVKWTEIFDPAEKYPRRYEARGVLSEAQRKSLGIPGLTPYLEGPLAADIAVLQPRTGDREVVLKLALKDTALWVPGFRWRKPAGREGVAWFRMLVGPQGKLNVQEFSVRSLGLTAKGSIEFDRDLKFARMQIGNFTLGRTDLSAKVRPTRDGGFDAEITGAALDAAPFLMPDDVDDPAGGTTETESALPRLQLHVNLDRVWFGDRVPVDRLTGDLERDKKAWRKVNLSGLVDQDHKVTFTYGADTDAEHLVVRSDNAGNALQALDIVHTVRDGTMTLSANRKGRRKDSPWIGSLIVSNFVLANAPMLAKILTVGSFSGMGDTLAGRGIRFAKLEAPFEFRNGIATIKNARTVGAELGFTAEGTVDTRSDVIKLGGTIVPAYTINSVLGNIPILGPIITGKDRAGIFAATYRIDGPLQKPEITVNPLAALAPGFLRNLIGVIEGSVQPDADTKYPGASDNE